MTAYTAQNWHQGSHTNLSISDIGGLRAMDDALSTGIGIPYTPVNKAGDTMTGTLNFNTVSPFTNSPTLFIRADWTGTETNGNLNLIETYTQAKGTWSTSHFVYANEIRIVDHTSVNQVNVTNAVNNGSGLIRLTAASHGYSTGDRIGVESVGGVTNSQGSWIVTVIDSNTLDLQGSTFAGSYTSGGYVTNRAGYACYLGLVAPQVSRGGLTGSITHADDVAIFFGSNNGTAKATDFIYLGHNSGMSTAEWDTAGSFDGASTYGLLLNNCLTGQTIRGSHYGSSAVPEYQGRMARGTFSAPLRTKSGDVMLRLGAVPAVAASDVATASFAGVSTRIDMTANEDQTVTNEGSNIKFYTTALATTTAAERFRVAPGDGIDFGSATVTNYMIRLKNDAWIQGLDSGASTVNVMRLSAANVIEFGKGLFMADPGNIILGTLSGTKIGTATNQKLAFFNSNPIVQPSSTGETVGFTAGAGTNVTDQSTFTGNVGSTAYRISDVVKHLKNLGLIAQ